MVTCHKKAGNFELFQKRTEVSRTIKTASMITDKLKLLDYISVATSQKPQNKTQPVLVLPVVLVLYWY